MQSLPRQIVTRRHRGSIGRVGQFGRLVREIHRTGGRRVQIPQSGLQIDMLGLPRTAQITGNLHRADGRHPEQTRQRPMSRLTKIERAIHAPPVECDLC